MRFGFGGLRNNWEFNDEFGFAGYGVQFNFSPELIHYDVADNIEA
jgi:hypothetical protein